MQIFLNAKGCAHYIRIYAQTIYSRVESLDETRVLPLASPPPKKKHPRRKKQSINVEWENISIFHNLPFLQQTLKFYSFQLMLVI